MLDIAKPPLDQHQANPLISRGSSRKLKKLTKHRKCRLIRSERNLPEEKKKTKNDESMKTGLVEALDITRTRNQTRYVGWWMSIPKTQTVTSLTRMVSRAKLGKSLCWMASSISERRRGTRCSARCLWWVGKKENMKKEKRLRSDKIVVNLSKKESARYKHTHAHMHACTYTHTLSLSRGVIGRMMGSYPRGTGSNPIEGNGHFFSLMLSALSFVFLWRTHTHTHTHTHTRARTRWSLRASV